jgi:hypothetical protein
MPFVIDVNRVKLDEANAYKNAFGAQCAALVQLTPLLRGTAVPVTRYWRRGVKVKDLAAAQIERGTDIATFDENGRYPSTQRHTAIYISHDLTGITVIDQWLAKPYASQRKLRYKGSSTRLVNDGDYYWIVETAETLQQLQLPAEATY